MLSSRSPESDYCTIAFIFLLNNVKTPIVIPKFLVYYQLQNFVDYTGEEIMYDYSTSFVGKGEVSEILHQKYNRLSCIAFYKDFITPFLFSV